jgi:hypothetical protein
MASIVIPYAPTIDIHIVSAVLSKDGTPEIVLYHREIRERIFPKYHGEVSYEMIKNDILCGICPFYARAYEEHKKNILRVIVPISHFYDIIKNNTHLNDSLIISITSTEYGFPKWISGIEWYIESSKQEPPETVDANEKGTRDSKTPQKSGKQQRSVPLNPPCREGDTVFWH